MTFLITGGAGFIGGNMARFLLERGCCVVNLDKLTYAGNLDSLSDLLPHPRHVFIQGDICDAGLLESVFTSRRPNAVLNLAAESHVDRSIDSPDDFIQTNVVGTCCLLNAALTYYKTLTDEEKNIFRFLHVSTDEVFGSLGKEGFFTESTPYAPNSPYSASKAAADHMVRAWGRTYGLPVLTTNCSNNYGPYQFPEKLIPHIIFSALQNKPLPIYGDGQNIRDWLHVSDHCRALGIVVENGKPGESYVIGGNCERTNLEIVNSICDTLDGLRPRRDGLSYREQVVFVRDRPGHDRRYAIDAEKIKSGLGWLPEWNFDSGILDTVRWYLKNETWAENILNGTYRLERLGKGDEK